MWGVYIPGTGMHLDFRMIVSTWLELILKTGVMKTGSWCTGAEKLYMQ